MKDLMADLNRVRADMEAIFGLPAGSRVSGTAAIVPGRTVPIAHRLGAAGLLAAGAVALWIALPHRSVAPPLVVREAPLVPLAEPAPPGIATSAAQAPARRSRQSPAAPVARELPSSQAAEVDMMPAPPSLLTGEALEEARRLDAAVTRRLNQAELRAIEERQG